MTELVHNIEATYFTYFTGELEISLLLYLNYRKSIFFHEFYPLLLSLWGQG